MRSRRTTLPVSPGGALSAAAAAPPRPARLIVLPEVLDAIRREALAYAPTETGGVLVGPPGGPLVAALLATGSHAERGSAHLVTEPAELQPALERVAQEKGWTFLGYWHSHPGDFDRPSWTDLTTAYRILADPDYGVAELLLPISIIKDGEVRTRWYRVDATGCVEIDVVVDSDSAADAADAVLLQPSAAIEAAVPATGDTTAATPTPTEETPP